MASKKEAASKKSSKQRIKYNELTLEELKKSEEELRKELFQLRFKVKVGSHANVRDIRENKRRVARILTAIKLKEAANS